MGEPVSGVREVGITPQQLEALCPNPHHSSEHMHGFLMDIDLLLNVKARNHHSLLMTLISTSANMGAQACMFLHHSAHSTYAVGSSLRLKAASLAVKMTFSGFKGRQHPNTSICPSSPLSSLNTISPSSCRLSMNYSKGLLDRRYQHATACFIHTLVRHIFPRCRPCPPGLKGTRSPWPARP